MMENGSPHGLSFFAAQPLPASPVVAYLSLRYFRLEDPTRHQDQPEDHVSAAPPVKPRPSQKRRPLVAAVAVLIIVGVAAAAWITIKEFQVQRNVFARILDQKLTATSSQFRYYLQPVNDDLAAMAGWWQSGLLDPSRPEAVASLLVPLLSPSPQIASAYIIPPEGPVYRLVYQADQWLHPAPTPDEADPRHSAWYEQARRVGREEAVAWSDYRILPGLGQRGLLVGRAAADGTVVAVGILKDNLDRFTATAPITENGILVRRFTDGQVAWLSPGAGGSLDTTNSSDLLVSDRPEHTVIGNALLEWGKRRRPYEQAFSFKVAGQTWWASFYPRVPGTDPGELFLIAPAGDLRRRLETVTGTVTMLFAAVLGLATLAVVILAFEYRNKWRRFARRRRPLPANETELLTIISAGESLQCEFKSTMRWNLHADKAGKEIELAWLKTVVAYLNTDGGFLLIGVSDDGEVLGTVADNFPNGDKFILHFDNLIQRHIGLQFAGWIHGGFHACGDKRVYLVNCDRCLEPVFLKKGDEELFYIRVGASSRQLPGSRVLEYLEERVQ